MRYGSTNRVVVADSASSAACKDYLSIFTIASSMLCVFYCASSSSLHMSPHYTLLI